MKKSVLLLIGSIVLFQTFISLDNTSFESSFLLNNSFIETTNISIFFCPEDPCEDILFKTLLSTNTSLICAFYDIRNPSLLAVFEELFLSGISLTILTEKDHGFIDASYILYDSNFALMHHKFCVIDEKIVISGSTNPTKNGLLRNQNNMLIISDSLLSERFLLEFSFLQDGTWRSPQKDELLPFAVYENLAVLFCPRDFCRDYLISLIKAANESIYFATFAFTDEMIASELLLAQERGVHIKGIIDSRMFSRSVGPLLQSYNVSVINDRSFGTMHHKYFVIDERKVFTGSYNPSRNGNLFNNENVVVIFDKEITSLYVEDFFNLILLNNKNI